MKSIVPASQQGQWWHAKDKLPRATPSAYQPDPPEPELTGYSAGSKTAECRVDRGLCHPRYHRLHRFLIHHESDWTSVRTKFRHRWQHAVLAALGLLECSQEPALPRRAEWRRRQAPAHPLPEWNLPMLPLVSATQRMASRSDHHHHRRLRPESLALLAQLPRLVLVQMRLRAPVRKPFRFRRLRWMKRNWG